MSVELQRTTDEIGEPDEINQVLFFDEIETLGLEAGPLILKRRNTVTDSIWDVDNWDEVNWEGDYDNIQVIERVVNPYNKYIERFLDNEFEDTGNTTATWSTSGSLTFSSGSSETAQSEPVYYNQDNIIKATLSVTGTGISNGVYYLSADGGSNWETVTPGTEHTFSNIGEDLRWKILNFVTTYTLVTESGDTITTEDGDELLTDPGDSTTTSAITITKLQINYEV